MTYKETVDYLYSRLPVFHHVGKAAYKANLDNITELCTRLGNPQKNFKTVHVAGTNGKGSVSHMLASVFHESGFKTGLYTSPHLIDFCERIKINGNEIPKEYVTTFVESHSDLIEVLNPSFFELITAMGFDYFSKQNIDIAIIETGLGGRLDATNIIIPELSIITNISLDHTDILGNTIEKIATEKAGIIKKSVPLVIGESGDKTKNIFIEKAKEQVCEIVFADEIFTSRTLEVSPFNRKIELEGNDQVVIYKMDLPGVYQEKNLATAIAAIELLKKQGFRLDEFAVKAGIENAAKNTGLQGRWQVLKQKPLIIVDTGHNEAGIKLLIEQLETLSFDRLHIIFGMVSDKDVEKILDLLPKAARYYFTKANVLRALDENELSKKGMEKQLIGKPFSTIIEALNSALNDAKPDDVVFVGGSTFVAAEAIDYFRK